MGSVAQVLEQMKTKFNPSAAAGLDEVFQFTVEDSDSFHVIVKDNDFKLVSGDHEDPSVTLIMDTDTLVQLMSGQLDGMQAFMGGKLRAEGNMTLGLKLSQLFPN